MAFVTCSSRLRQCWCTTCHLVPENKGTAAAQLFRCSASGYGLQVKQGMPATGTGPATVPALVNISFTEASRPSLCRSLQMPNNSKMCGGKCAPSSMLFEMVLNCKLWNAMSSQTPLLCKVFCSNVGAGCGGRQQALTCARACSACNNVCMSIHADL